MSRPYLTACFILLYAVYFSCSKKETTKPVTVPATTGTSTATHTDTVVFSKYPYTDTFQGKMVTTYDASCPYFDSVNGAFRFYVQHLDQSRLVFISAHPIALQWRSSTMVNDTCIANDSGAFTGDMVVYRPVYDTKNVYSKAFAFSFSGDSLYVNWLVSYMPLIGACDYGNSIGQYEGVMQKNPKGGRF